MKAINNNIVVQFDEKHNQELVLGNTTIYLQHEWRHKQDDETATTKMEYSTNGLQSKPQIAVVTGENDKYGYSIGDKLFLHYMAYETGQYIGEKEGDAFINVHHVIFTFKEDGTYQSADGIYIGKQVLSEDEKTKSGIIINPYGKKPMSLQVKLTHIPLSGGKKSLPEHDKLEVGDTILTIDDNQYIFKVGDENYVMLREHEIIARLKDGKIQPIA